MSTGASHEIVKKLFYIDRGVFRLSDRNESCGENKCRYRTVKNLNTSSSMTFQAPLQTVTGIKVDNSRRAVKKLYSMAGKRNT